MRLQLSAVDIQSYVKDCLPKSTLASDSKKVLAAFQERRHSPFSLRDLNAVLRAIGHPWENVVWKEPWEALVEVVTGSSGKGMYTLPEPKKTLTYTHIMREIAENSLDKHVASKLKLKFSHMDWDELLATTHVWLFEWAKRGTCDEYIKKLQPPTAAIFAAWVEGKIHQATYHDAQDALNREFRGLRTQKEILKRNKDKLSDYLMPGSDLIDPAAPDIVWEKTEEEQAARPVFVAAQADDEPDPYSVVRDCIRVMRKRSPERYAVIFDKYMSGAPKEEVAVLEECSPMRVAHLYQKIRDDMRAAPHLIRIAKRVLSIVAEEPFSTAAEIEKESTANPVEVKKALNLLLLRGLVTEARGQSFAPTKTGLEAELVGVL